MNVASPCLRLCQLDAEGLCLGCFRRLDEIAGWMRLSDDEKTAVIAAADERRKRRCSNDTNNE